MSVLSDDKTLLGHDRSLKYINQHMALLNA